MDQVKVGKFIAERRKSVNLTQLQLAEKLAVSDRAVSKWETGKAMPDSALMLQLSSILGITVNDLLSGEVVSGEKYDSELENKLLQALRENERKDKQLLMLEVLIGVLSVLILLIPIIIGAYVPFEQDWMRIVIICSGILPCMVGIVVALIIEQTAGYYECKHCKHRYVPSFKEVSLSAHMGRTRYMKCPNCGKKSWQRKVIGKK
ncbi:MAG: helix-turn-helix domain-containing protein [Clostridia bacterium]|nr:helix-turn-helix domain-containing protein [Clostridia bacterium]